MAGDSASSSRRISGGRAEDDRQGASLGPPVSVPRWKSYPLVPPSTTSPRGMQTSCMALLLLACAACATWTWHGVHIALHAQQAREPRMHMADRDTTLPAAMGAAGSSGRQIMADQHSSQQQQPHTALPSAPLPALWATLQLHARRRQQQQQQQQPHSPPTAAPPPPPPPPAQARHTAAASRQAVSIRRGGPHDPSSGSQSAEGSAPALNMSWSEAAAMSELLFVHVLDAQSLASLPEFRHPQHAAAARLLSLLQRLWRAHASAPTGGTAAGSTAGGGTLDLSGDHCSMTSGAELLHQAADAAAELQAAACAAAAAAHASLLSPDHKPLQQWPEEWGALPYVALRRAAVLVLHLAYQHAEEQARDTDGWQRKAACRKALSKAGSSMLLSFASAFNCSRSARPAMELFHVSKSGGTSMCQLAAAAGLANPHFDIAGNCMVAGFDGDPRWSRIEPFMRSDRVTSVGPSFWPAVECPTWQTEPEKASCTVRAPQLLSKSINFYANELTLHGGNGTLGSAAPCPQVETVIVLRDPVERTRSHVIEVDRVYRSFVGRHQEFTRSRNLTSWQSWAPAVVDNYMTRSLLGRHFLCRDFGALGAPEVLAAARALTSLDHVLVLEEGRLNDVALRAGMGWKAGLRNKHWRWAMSHDLHRDLGFQPDSMQLLYQWNALDAQLYTWGQLLLRVDASFHTAVAALTGRMEPPCSGKAAQTPPPLPSQGAPPGDSSQPLLGTSSHSAQSAEAGGGSGGPAALGSGALSLGAVGGRRSLQSANRRGHVTRPGRGGSAASSSLTDARRALQRATGQQQGYAVLAHRSGGGQVLERHGGGATQEQRLAKAQALADEVAAAAVAAARAAPHVRSGAQAQMQARSGPQTQMQAHKFAMYGYVFVQDLPGLPGTAPPALPLHLELLPAGLQHSSNVEAALVAGAGACRNNSGSSSGGSSSSSSSSASSSSHSGNGVGDARHGQGGNGGNGRVDGSGSVAGRGLDTVAFLLPLYMPIFGQQGT